MTTWGERLVDSLDRLAMTVDILIVVICLFGIAGFFVGCLVFILRSAQSHFGMGHSYEREGDLHRALKHYRLAARYGAGGADGRAAQERVREIIRRLEEQ